MATTIKDVAKLAGVSITTVSLVLNGHDRLRQETAERVRKAAREAGYVPNQYARSLITKNKKVIGVIRLTDEPMATSFGFASTVDTYLNDMLWSIEGVGGEHECGMVLDWYDAKDGLYIPKILDPNKVDGILCVGGIINDVFLEKIRQSGIPVVFVGSRNEGFDWVDTDGAKAISLATDHVISQGHRDLLFLNGPAISQSSGRKKEGFLSSAGKAGLPESCYRVIPCDFSGLSAYQAMSSLSEDFKPSAVICAADCMAVGVIRYAGEQGLSCPKDLSVIGYEDGILAEYSNPPLSTIRIDKARLGEEACGMLFERIADPLKKPEGRLLQPQLVIRQSVSQRKQEKETV
mgnify:CR=1 FL=1